MPESHRHAVRVREVLGGRHRRVSDAARAQPSRHGSIRGRGLRRRHRTGRGPGTNRRGHPREDSHENGMRGFSRRWTQPAHRPARHEEGQARRRVPRPGDERRVVSRVPPDRRAARGGQRNAREASKGGRRRGSRLDGALVRRRRDRAALRAATRAGSQGGRAAQGRGEGCRYARVGGAAAAKVGRRAGHVGGSVRGGLGSRRLRREALRRGRRAHATAQGQGPDAHAQDPSRGGQRAGELHERVHRPRRLRQPHPIEHRVRERRRRRRARD